MRQNHYPPRFLMLQNTPPPLTRTWPSWATWMQVVWLHLGLRPVRRPHPRGMLIGIFPFGRCSPLALATTTHLLQQANLSPMDTPHLPRVKGPLSTAPLVALPWAGLTAAPPLLLQPSSASTVCTGSKLMTRSPQTTVTRTWTSRQRVRRCRVSQRRRRSHHGQRREKTPLTATTPHRRPPPRRQTTPSPPSVYVYWCASATQ